MRKFNVNPKNYQDFLPPEFSIKVNHLHHFNDPSGYHRYVLSNSNGNETPKYVTVAQIGRDHGKGIFEPIYEGVATCSKHDNPSRSLGWKIAVGRALCHFWGRYE